MKTNSSAKPNPVYEDEVVDEPQKEEYKGMDINDLLELIGDLNPVKMKSAKNKANNNGPGSNNSNKKMKKKEINNTKTQSKGQTTETGQSKSDEKKKIEERLTPEDLFIIENFKQALVINSVHVVNVMKSKPQLDDTWIKKIKEL